jgi:preprotein translocase subunit SecA
VEEQRELVMEAGGLFILGTERHESRRIDNQLRGRSGRQGDPGESRFYLSGEDELVRLFAGNRIYSIMDRFKLPDDQPMEAGILSRQIENAQKKVEEQNFVMRKNVLKYDDVMNTQRQVIYAQRRQVLEGEDLSDQVHDWIRETIQTLVWEYTQGDYAEEWDLGALLGVMEQLYQTEITLDELREEVGLDRHALIEEFVEDALDEYHAKEEELEALEEGLMRNLERYVVLQVVDHRWREHLENMEYLREGIHLRAMAQKDPLTEYRSEGHAMFEALGRTIREEVVSILFHAQVEAQDAEALAEPMPAAAPSDGHLAYEHQTAAGADALAASAGVSTAAAAGGGSVSTTVVKRPEQQLGRNDPCWCGSGKKYKKCHGA